MYREMQVIRKMEERARELYMTKSIRGFCHLYIGQVCTNKELGLDFYTFLFIVKFNNCDHPIFLPFIFILILSIVKGSLYKSSVVVYVR